MYVCVRKRGLRSTVAHRGDVSTSMEDIEPRYYDSPIRVPVVHLSCHCVHSRQAGVLKLRNHHTVRDSERARERERGRASLKFKIVTYLFFSNSLCIVL